MFLAPVGVDSSEAGVSEQGRCSDDAVGSEAYDIDDMVGDSSPTIGEDVFCPVLGHPRREEKADYYV